MKGLSFNIYGQLTPTKGILPRRADPRTPQAGAAIYLPADEPPVDLMEAASTQAVTVNAVTDDWSDDDIEVDIVVEQEKISTKPIPAVVTKSVTSKASKGRGGCGRKKASTSKAALRLDLSETDLGTKWPAEEIPVENEPMHKADTEPLEEVDVGEGKERSRGQSYCDTIDEVLYKYSEDDVAVEPTDYSNITSDIAKQTAVYDMKSSPVTEAACEKEPELAVEENENIVAETYPDETIINDETISVSSVAALPPTSKKKKKAEGKMRKKKGEKVGRGHKGKKGTCIAADVREEVSETIEQPVIAPTPVFIQPSPPPVNLPPSPSSLPTAAPLLVQPLRIKVSILFNLLKKQASF